MANEDLTLSIGLNEREAMRQLARLEASFVRAAKKSEDAWKKSNKSAAESAAVFGQEFDRLRSKYDPLFAASKRYEAQLNELNQAHKVGAINAVQHSRALDALNDEYARATGAIKPVGAAIVKTNRAATALSGQGLRMASLQLSQVAQQGAATGNYLQALAIQLPDLALGFGTIGIAAGVVAGALLPVAANLLGVGDAGAEFEDAISDLTKAIDAFRAAGDKARASNKSLAEDFGKNTSAAREMLRVIASLEKLEALKAMRDGVSEFRQAFSGIQADISLFTASYDEAFAAGGIRAEQAADDLARTFGLTYDAAIQLRDALDRMSTVNGPDEVAAATRAITDALVAAYGSAEAIPTKMLEMASAAAGVNIEALRLQAAIAAATDETVDLSDGLDTAKGRAESLADMAGTIADAIDSASASAVAFLGIDGTPPWIDGTIRRLAALQEWVSKMAAPVGVSAYQGGRGGDPRQMGGAAKDWQAGDMGAQLAYSGQAGTPLFVPPKSSGGRGGGGGGGGGGGVSEIDKATQSYERLMASLDPLIAAEQAFAEGQTTLDAALKANIINQDEYAAGMDLLSQKFAEAKIAGEEFGELGNLLKDSILDFAENGVDALDDLAAAIRRAALEALLFGEGPLGKVLGGAGGGGLLGGLISSAFGGARATGGGVRAGIPYLVNENTPNSEVFVPSQSGAILNVAQAQEALSNAVSGGGRSEVVVRVSSSEDLVATAVAAGRSQAVSVVQEYDRSQLPRSVARVQKDPRRIG